MTRLYMRSVQNQANWPFDLSYPNG